MLSMKSQKYCEISCPTVTINKYISLLLTRCVSRANRSTTDTTDLRPAAGTSACPDLTRDRNRSRNYQPAGANCLQMRLSYCKYVSLVSVKYADNKCVSRKTDVFI